MGFLDSLLNGLEIAAHVANELFKDSPRDIANWINEMQDSGASSVNLKREESGGILTVNAKAFDSDGDCLEKKQWQFECNSGIKRLWSGIGEGLECIVDLFEGEDDITYDLTDDEDNGENNSDDDDDEEESEDEEDEDEDLDDEDDEDDDEDEEDDFEDEDEDFDDDDDFDDEDDEDFDD